MKTIRVTQRDGTIRIFNPMHITDVKLVASEYNKDWCIILNLNSKSSDSIYTILHTSREEAEREFEYIQECLESV